MLIFYLIAIYFVQCSYFDCNTTTIQSTTVTCLSDENCLIDCDYMNINDHKRCCANAIIYAPENANLTLNVGFMEGGGLKVYGASNGNVRIVCSPWYGCSSATFYGPNNGNLFLHCRGPGACSSANINCPMNGQCDILCDSGCEAAIINATNMVSGDLSIVSVHTGGANALLDSHIYCPLNDNDCIISCGYFGCKNATIYANNDASNLYIDATDSAALESSDIYCPTASGVCSIRVTANAADIVSNTKIYAVDGFDNLYFFCNYTSDINQCYRNVSKPILFFGIDLSDSCDMELNNGFGEWQCAPTPSPTAPPTETSLQPTAAPTAPPSSATGIPSTALPTTTMPSTSLPTESPSTELLTTYLPNSVSPTNLFTTSSTASFTTNADDVTEVEPTDDAMLLLVLYIASGVILLCISCLSLVLIRFLRYDGGKRKKKKQNDVMVIMAQKETQSNKVHDVYDTGRSTDNKQSAAQHAHPREMQPEFILTAKAQTHDVGPEKETHGEAGREQSKMECSASKSAEELYVKYETPVEKTHATKQGEEDEEDEISNEEELCVTEGNKAINGKAVMAGSAFLTAGKPKLKFMNDNGEDDSEDIWENTEEGE